MNKRLRIGFIDSGVGGILFAKQMYQILRNKMKDLSVDIEFVHILDQKNLPYGSKTKDQILPLTDAMIKKAQDLGLETIFIACNTMSTVISDPRQYQSLRVITLLAGTSEYLYKEAQKFTPSPNISIIATEYTIKSGAYNKTLSAIQEKEKLYTDLNITSVKMPNWVGYAEGYYNNNNKACLNHVRAEIENEIDQNHAFKESNIIAICCTHYILFANILLETFLSRGKDIKVVNQSDVFFPELLQIISEKDTHERSKGSLRVSCITTSEDKRQLRNFVENLYKGEKDITLSVE